MSKKKLAIYPITKRKNNLEMMAEIEMTTMDTDRLLHDKSILSPASTPSGHMTDEYTFYGHFSLR